MHRAMKRGTFILDRVFGGVGRIRRASGTTDPATFKAIDATLTNLHQTDRLDLLAAIRDGTAKPIDVWLRCREEGIATRSVTPHHLSNVVLEWIDTHPVSEHHRRDMRYCVTALLNGDTVPLAELPERLRAYRTAKARKPAMFNRTRSALMAYFRHTLGRRHPLYGAVADVPPLREVKAAGSPLEPKHLKGLPPMALTMALTGMGPSEYWGRWEILADRVCIHGTKREGRERVVPLVRKAKLVPPSMTYKPFRLLLAAHGIKPYDLRRTYAVLLDDAGIPQSRQRAYMGHGPRTTTALYQRRNIEPHLKSDARRLATLLRGKL